MVESSERRRLSRRGVLGLLAAAGAVPVLQVQRPGPGLEAGRRADQAARRAPAPTTAPAAARRRRPPPAPTTAPAGAPTTAPAAGATPAAKAPAASGVEIEVATRVGSDAENMVKSVVDFTAQTGIKAKHVAYPAEPNTGPRSRPSTPPSRSPTSSGPRPATCTTSPTAACWPSWTRSSRATTTTWRLCPERAQDPLAQRQALRHALGRPPGSGDLYNTDMLEAAGGRRTTRGR